MNKKLFFVSISLVGILVLPIFSLGQTTGQAQAGQAQAPSLSEIDCSQYSNTQEKLLCSYFNTLLKFYTLLIKQLQVKISQPVQPISPVQPSSEPPKLIKPQPVLPFNLPYDSDNSPDYMKGFSYPITLEKYPDLFTAGKAMGDYIGSSGVCIYGKEPNPTFCKPTEDKFTTYYDHCVNSVQLNEGFITSDKKIGAFRVNAPEGYECKNGAFVLVKPYIQPSITVLSPNGGETYTVGQTIPISFKTNLDDKQTTGITFQLYKLIPGKPGMELIQTIVTNWKGGPPYYWTIPQNIADGEYIIYAIAPFSDLQWKSIDDASDNFFYIKSVQSRSSITILSPSNNQILTSQINISWTETPMSANAIFGIDIKVLESNYYAKDTLVVSTRLTPAQANCSNSDKCFYSINLLPGKYSLMVTDYNTKGGVSDIVNFEVKVRETYAGISYFTASKTVLNSGDTTNFEFRGKNINYYDLNFNCSVAVRGIYNNAWDVCNRNQRISGDAFNFPVTFINNDGNYSSNVIVTLVGYDSNHKVADTKSVTVTINPKSTTVSSPSLSINKTSFLTTDTWQLTLTGAQPNQQVYICAIDNRGVQSCTPVQNLGLRATTDSNGNWFASGNWNGDESVVGTWIEWIIVGGTLQNGQVTGGVRSNNITFTISRPQNTCQGYKTLVITPPSATINVSQTQNFRALYDPDGPSCPQPEQDKTSQANWNSSNSNVASFNGNGSFIARSAGSATITAIFDGITAWAVLNVNQIFPPQTNIDILSYFLRKDLINYPNNSSYKYSPTQFNLTDGVYTIQFNQFTNNNGIFLEKWRDPTQRVYYAYDNNYIYLKYDSTGVWPYSFSDGRWLKRYMNVGDIINANSNQLKYYKDLTTNCVVSSTQAWPYMIKLASSTRDVLPSIGSVDIIIVEYYWGYYSNEYNALEKEYYAKDYGIYKWEEYIKNDLSGQWELKSRAYLNSVSDTSSNPPPVPSGFCIY